MTRCQFCDRLSILDLVDRYHILAEQFTATRVEPEVLYDHHPSFEGLELAAEWGCDLCGLIQRLFKSVDGRDTDSWIWPKYALECQRKGPISVQSLVKELPDSRVRMCLYYNLMYDVYVLDTLLVHVGLEWAKLDCERTLPTLRMKLTATPGLEDKAVVVDVKYRLGSLPVDPYTGSKTNFELARKWLSNCQQQHDNCLSGRPPSLPTRVIDVGIDAAYQNVHLEVNTKGLEAEYVALSHCWGGKIATMLTKDNLEMYSMDGIPLEKLPANFQDAIKVTQELGIRYLWIDSLCILQGQDADDIADWEQESKAMTIVYRDCTLTISALASEKSTDGFLTYKTDVGESAEETSTWIRVLPVAFGDSNIQAEVRRFDPKREESLFELETEGPLALRGWTLQENVLSPRHLFYGANLIHWACPSGYKSANGLLGIRDRDQKYPDLSPILFDGILRRKSRALQYDKEKIFQSYYDLVERFSARKLTCPSDKLPALSGIAQRLQPILGDYLAGIWRDGFARGLLWWVKEGEDDSACPASEYRAPSWSWASMDGALSYIYLGRLQPEDSLDAHYIDHNIHLADPTNPFGQIKDGASLTLRGLTLRVVRPLPYRKGEDFDLCNIQFDEKPSCGNQSQASSSMLKPDSGSNVAGTGYPSKIELGRYRVNPGQYLILLLRLSIKTWV